MSDCIWALAARCERGNCGECKHKVATDSVDGKLIERQYWQDVEEALEPVFREYIRVMRTYMEERG